MLRMEPDAEEPLAEGHAAVLAVQEGCCVAASQGGGAASAEAGGHREAAGGHCEVASAAAHSEPEAQFHSGAAPTCAQPASSNSEILPFLP